MKNITEIVKKAERPVKVLQFGEGNFLRAFVDWIIDNLNEKTDFNGNVMMVQPLANGMGDMINAQNGLYTTCLRGIQNGKPVEQFRQITSVAGCINPYSEYDKFIAQASNPDLRFIISNTTEAGIAYKEGDKLEDKPQTSFPGKVCAFLYNRYKAFGGDPSKGEVYGYIAAKGDKFILMLRNSGDKAAKYSFMLPGAGRVSGELAPFEIKFSENLK